MLPMPEKSRLTCIVLAGKAGDLLNAMGMARHLYFKSGIKTPWIVSAKYAQVLLNAASYVEPVIVHFQIHELDKAMMLAKQRYSTVLNAQAFGKIRRAGYSVPYNVASWLSAGFTEEQFHDSVNFPLVLDRDKEREDFLYRRHVHGKKPLLLLNLGCGKSSPFHGHHQLTEAIKKKWSHTFEILSLCDVKAARISDLLGIIDKAKLLITTDSAVLHLATASSVPMVCLLNDGSWLGTRPRREPHLQMRYGEVAKRTSEIHAAILAFALDRKPLSV